MILREALKDKVYYTVPWALFEYRGKDYLFASFACFEQPKEDFTMAVRLNKDGTASFDESTRTGEKRIEGSNLVGVSRFTAVQGALV